MSDAKVIGGAARLEAQPRGGVLVGVLVGDRVESVRLEAHQVHELALALTELSLSTAHQACPPASYDLVFTLCGMATAAHRDAFTYLSAIAREGCRDG